VLHRSAEKTHDPDSDSRRDRGGERLATRDAASPGGRCDDVVLSRRDAHDLIETSGAAAGISRM